jgi:hypothetical protein
MRVAKFALIRSFQIKTWRIFLCGAQETFFVVFAALAEAIPAP